MICVLWYVSLRGCIQDHPHMGQVGDYEAKSVIGTHATFSLSSKTTDLDEKFRQALGSMDLDTTGGLVEILSRQGIYRAAISGSWRDDSHVLLEYLQLVIAPWKDFASDWVARCTTDNEGVYFVHLAESSDPLM